MALSALPWHQDHFSIPILLAGHGGGSALPLHRYNHADGAERWMVPRNWHDQKLCVQDEFATGNTRPKGGFCLKTRSLFGSTTAQAGAWQSALEGPSDCFMWAQPSKQIDLCGFVGSAMVQSRTRPWTMYTEYGCMTCLHSPKAMGKRQTTGDGTCPSDEKNRKCVVIHSVCSAMAHTMVGLASSMGAGWECARGWTVWKAGKQQLLLSASEASQGALFGPLQGFS